MNKITLDRIILFLIGALLIGLGVLGFMSTDKTVLALFHVNTFLNIVHIGIGLIAIYKGMTDKLIVSTTVSELLNKKWVPASWSSADGFEVLCCFAFAILGFIEIVYAIIKIFASDQQHEWMKIMATGFFHLVLGVVFWISSHLEERVSK